MTAREFIMFIMDHVDNLDQPIRIEKTIPFKAKTEDLRQELKAPYKNARIDVDHDAIRKRKK